ncbi:MAG TPA: PAS domain S-box protein [Ohtaekwangia sp.]|uniref:PAS domain S-box protein n=1 Tax=Ohtaekwangia sp. TaxID=2066019 RepID=UPI002F95EAF1
MNIPLSNACETGRLDALRKFRILDTRDEQDLNDIVTLAASICGTPMCVISLVDDERQWFKARVGLNIQETPREQAFCAYTILQDDILIVADATKDLRFATSALVTGEPGVRFYAGMPLITSEGYKIGTLCVMDRVPKELNDFQLTGLRTLANNVTKQIELKYVISEMDVKAKNLEESNYQLNVLNQELLATEEEIRSNLDHIQMLQDHLEIRERQYRELVEDAPDLIYELDPNGNFVFVNPVMERISGYSKDELLQMKYWELVHPNCQQQLMNFYKSQRRNLQSSSYFQFLMITKTGEEIWVGQSVRMLFDEHGRVYKVSVIARDITELKQIDIKRAESERRFRLLAGNAPVGIFQTDAAGLCTYVNKRWCEIAGISEHEAKGEGWMQVIHPGDRHKVLAEWAVAVAGARKFVIEFRFVNPQRGVRWVISEGVEMQDENGNLQGYIGTTHDITELKEVNEKLQESEELYRLLSRNSKDLVTLFRIDDAATRTFISPSVKDILGYTPEEMVGYSPYDNIHPEDEVYVKEVIQSVIFSGKSATVEYRAIRKDGSFVWLESNAHPFYNDEGDMIGFQTSARDISKRKEFEASLQIAKEKAEEATKAKSLFLSMMSHEIRTPMNAIIGLTNLLVQNDPREDQRERLDLLKFSGQNLLTIINDILDFSKIEAGKVVLESINFNLQDMLSDTRQMLEMRAQEKQIGLHFTYDPSLPVFVKGDTVRLSQIVTNLLSNAIKFTEHGSVDFSVTALGEEKGKTRMLFKVKDTGIGIEPDKLRKIFEQFSQADNDITRRFGGTGLGLNITKGLLELMDSHIELESEPGKGSTFSFQLLFEKGEDIAAAGATADTGQSLTGKQIKVLLVEDNKINQLVATNFMEQWGVQVQIANDGLEAIDMIRSKSFNMVFMDLQMPRMDGYEASHQIRLMEEKYFRDIPIIALTASAMNGMRDKVVEMGMNDFISKPFNPDELKAKIGKYSTVK